KLREPPPAPREEAPASDPSESPGRENVSGKPEALLPRSASKAVASLSGAEPAQVKPADGEDEQHPRGSPKPAEAPTPPAAPSSDLTQAGPPSAAPPKGEAAPAPDSRPKSVDPLDGVVPPPPITRPRRSPFPSCRPPHSGNGIMMAAAMKGEKSSSSADAAPDAPA